MSDHTLVLCPVDPEAPLPPTSDLRAKLFEVGFIGDPLSTSTTTNFNQGARFAELVPFFHSHTAVIIGPPGTGPEAYRRVDSRTLCSIELEGPRDEIEFLGGENAETPSCPACNREEENWMDLVSAWHDDRRNYFWTCPQCQNSWRPWQLDWAHTNGFGRFSIVIWHVKQGEAAPNRELMDFLQRVTRVRWNYFYFHL